MVNKSVAANSIAEFLREGKVREELPTDLTATVEETRAGRSRASRVCMMATEISSLTTKG
jgi:hypothetical protein